MEYATILTRIRQIVRAVNVESKRLQKEAGISIPQLLCLNFLSQQEELRASHSQIKSFVQLNASTVTGIITRLEAKGLVARLPRTEDKRVRYITITAKGVELLRDIPEPMHARITQRLRALSDEELEKLQGSFDYIIEFLKIDSDYTAPIVTADISSD